jgi:gamma-glutamylcyclotransferase (GGCT)/AIG2-like uncharacterized protein YtfP
MGELVFFYGTLMTPFQRAGRADLDAHLRFIGHGTIRAALFDLGLYPAAVPSEDSTVRGEVHEILDEELVLPDLDGIEGYRANELDQSLYVRGRAMVSLEDGRTVEAWVYFYNAPLGRADRIASGNYLEHLRGSRPV